MQLSWIISSAGKLSILSVGRYTYTSDLRFQPVMRDDPADDSETWTLRIRRVKLEDEAKYECQINTKPEKSRHVYLRVVGELVPATPHCHCPFQHESWSSSKIEISDKT